MKRRGFVTDPSFWLLLAVNVYLVWYYYQHPLSFRTLIWIYWCQSVLLGLFNFLDMLTVRKVEARVDANGKPTSDSFTLKVPAAFFFLVHYGGFHFVYLFFVATMHREQPLDWPLFKYCVMAFLAGQLVQFIQHKMQQRKDPARLATMFFTPYLRVVPMHLTILLPNFFNIGNLGLFLVLKCIADVLMYLVTRPSYKDRNMDAAAMATQQSSGMV